MKTQALSLPGTKNLHSAEATLQDFQRLPRPRERNRLAWLDGGLRVLALVEWFPAKAQTHRLSGSNDEHTPHNSGGNQGRNADPHSHKHS